MSVAVHTRTPVPPVQFEKPNALHPPIEAEIACDFYRLTVEQYHAMINAGILMDDDPVELLEGWLVTKMPKHPRHRGVIEQLRWTIEKLLPPGWYIGSQDPVTTEASEPEPDLIVTKANLRTMRDRHPRPEEIALVVEVADSSLRTDRRIKKRLYARSGIPVYWIVNLIDGVVEVYTDPTGPAAEPDYRSRRDYVRGETIPLMIDAARVGEIPVNEIFLEMPAPSE